MLSDYEDVIGQLLEENERLRRENSKQSETIASYINKNNELWMMFNKAGRIEEARV